MKKFHLRIKERNGGIVTPTYTGDVTRAFIEDFFGVHNDDVEWYEIKETEV